jgi:hypothetical protein
MGNNSDDSSATGDQCAAMAHRNSPPEGTATGAWNSTSTVWATWSTDRLAGQDKDCELSTELGGEIEALESCTLLYPTVGYRMRILVRSPPPTRALVVERLNSIRVVAAAALLFAASCGGNNLKLITPARVHALVTSTAGADGDVNEDGGAEVHRIAASAGSRENHLRGAIRMIQITVGWLVAATAAIVLAAADSGSRSVHTSALFSMCATSIVDGTQRSMSYSAIV